MNGLVVGGCHFQAFWVGSKPSKSTFLRFLELKNKRKKQGKNENIGKCPKKSENRNFGGDILSISIENQNFADISVEIFDILFPGYKI